MLIGNVTPCSRELRRSAQCSNCVLDDCTATYHTCMRLFVSGRVCGGLWCSELYTVVRSQEFQHVQLLLSARKVFNPIEVEYGILKDSASHDAVFLNHLVLASPRRYAKMN